MLIVIINLTYLLLFILNQQRNELNESNLNAVEFDEKLQFKIKMLTHFYPN